MSDDIQLIPKQYWIVFSTDEIGPLEYVSRYNGGAYSFRYCKGSQILIACNRGVYSPYCYQPHSGGRKAKQIGNFYKFMTDSGNTYYCSIKDAEVYLPELLPNKNVAHKIIKTSSVLDTLINKVYAAKNIIIEEKNLDENDNITEANIFTKDTKQLLCSFEIDVNDNLLCKFFINDELINTKKILIPSDLQNFICDIITNSDFIRTHKEYLNDFKLIYESF